MLKIDLKVGESIRVGDAVITLEDKSGKSARLSIEAPKSISIDRVSNNSASFFAKGGIAKN